MLIYFGQCKQQFYHFILAVIALSLFSEKGKNMLLKFIAHIDVQILILSAAHLKENAKIAVKLYPPLTLDAAIAVINLKTVLRNLKITYKL